MKINYGINRSLPSEGKKKRRIEHQCHTMTIRTAFSWEDDFLHQAIRRKIKRRHPGWMITGYCEARPR
jgi:hypothetical protein